VKITLAIVATMIAMTVAAAVAGSWSWRRATHAEIDALSPGSMRGVAFDPAMLYGVPRPAARYLQKAITVGHPLVRSAIATQDAEFFINGQWRPLRATQHFTISPPGFVWDAQIDMAPLMPVFVRDAYVNGHAKMQASMYGVYPLANQVDKPELNAGALQRFLGESVWFPTALLPSTTVEWRPRADRSALVTLTDNANEVSLLFEFGDDGMPWRIGGDRYKEDNGRYTMQPWQITCDDHAIRDGLMIPLRCEVAWMNNGVREAYWRGRITSIDFQYDVME
jgi:hypothetical protein